MANVHLQLRGECSETSFTGKTAPFWTWASGESGGEEGWSTRVPQCLPEELINKGNFCKWEESHSERSCLLGRFYLHGGLFSNSHNGSKAMWGGGLQKTLRHVFSNAFSLPSSRKSVGKQPPRGVTDQCCVPEDFLLRAQGRCNPPERTLKLAFVNSFLTVSGTN